MADQLGSVSETTNPSSASPAPQQGNSNDRTGNDRVATDDEKQLSMQISISKSQQSAISDVANEGGRMMQLGTNMDKRILDKDGNLVFNRTEEEKERENEIEKKLTSMCEEQKFCSINEWEALLELQCPLPPRNYDYKDANGDRKTVNTTARVYHKKFWVRHPETGIIYEAITDKDDVKKHQKRLDQMRAVDEYLHAFKLTSSVDIYTRFKRAVGFLEDSNMTKSEKKKEEISYKLIPGWTDRMGFFAILARGALNAYFIYYNLESAFLYDDGKDKPFKDNLFYFIAILITAGAEAYLFLVAFLRTAYNSWSLLKRVFQRDTTHFQTKNMPMQIREMASTSILRYLPSGESTNRFRKRWKESYDEIMEDYRFAVENARKHPGFVKIREIISILFIIFGPLLAIISLIFKISSLDLDPDNLFKFNNGFGSWLIHVITYAGFVNQIASIRKVRLIEMNALQHFVFSGNDVKLSKHERQMMNVWWNYTIVSCVANISDKFKYPTFDSIVFWYQINPRKLQILLKNHDAEGVDFLESKVVKGRRKIQTKTNQKYDKTVEERAKEKYSERQLSKLDMVVQDQKTEHEDEEEEDIIVSNAHSQKQQRQSQLKENEQVPDESDNQNENENENDNNTHNENNQDT